MSEAGAPAVGEEQVGPASQQSSTSSARMQQEPPPPFLEAGAGEVGSPASVSSSGEVDIMSAVGAEQGPVSQQPFMSSARAQEEPLPPLLEAGDEETSDSVSSSVDTEFMSSSASAARARLWSPQPSTSLAKLQLKLQPFVKAGEAKWTHEVSSHPNLRSSWASRATRPWSPQPSTSAAGLLMERELQPFFDPADVTEDHMYAQDLSVRRTPMGSWEARSSSPQPSTSSAGMQFEKQQFVKASDEKSTDSTGSDFSLAQQDMRRTPMGFWDTRSSSPQPSTSSAGIEFEIQQFVKPVGVKSTDSKGSDFSLAQQDMRRPPMRSSSPQPSTSSAAMEYEMQQFFKRGDAKSADSTGSFSAPQDMGGVWQSVRAWSPTAPTTPAAMMLQLELKPVNREEGGTGCTSLDSIYSQLARNISDSLGGPWSQPPTTMSGMADDNNTDPILPPKQYIDYSEIGRKISAPVRRKLRRWAPQQLSPSAQKQQQEMQTTMEAGGGTSPEFTGHAQNLSAPRVRRKWRPPQQLTPPAPAQKAQVELPTAMEASGSTSPDTELTACVAQNLSIPEGEGKKRPWSPPPSTSAAARIQLQMMPLREAIESESDAFSMSVAQNISALVEEKKMRTRSPQPSTSSAPMQPYTSSAPMQPAIVGVENITDDGSASAAQNISVPVGEVITPPASESSTSTAATMDATVEQPPQEPASKNPANSVYAHVPHNISNIPQLRGLKAGRRHGRLRRLHTQNKLNEKYGPMIQYFGPMVAEESAKKQTQHILITSALDHFANIINQIVDKHEGKVDTTGFRESLQMFSKRMEDRREKRRKQNPDATEEPLPRSLSPPTVSDAETNRRLREETEAAVEALLTGERSRERSLNRYAEIIKSFQDAYDPKIPK